MLGTRREPFDIRRSIDSDLYSFAEISRAYGISADLNIAYQGERASGMTLGGELCEAVPLSLDTAKFPLAIDVWHRDGQYGYTAEYRRDLYTEAFISRFISAMDEVVRAFMEAKTLSGVSLLTAAEAEVIDGFNDTDWPVRMQSVNRLFEDQARRHPNRPAVIAGGEMLTYTELDARANRIANALVARGVALDDTVGMLLDRTADAVAVEYGIMKAGGAFLPLIPDYPDERIDYCMSDSASRFLITTDDILDARRNLLTSKGFESLTVARLLEEGGDDAPELDIPASALAYCICTSGSTGKPKGVMIEHGNLCNFVDANERNDECRHFVESGSVALGIAALSFDFSLMEIHLTLCNGMTLCMAGADEIHNPLLLADLIRRNNVDVISGTPSFLANMLEVPQAVCALRDVKMYDLGAETFPPTLYAKLRAASPDALIVNGYGPTEATISCISKVIENDSHVTIGKPAANVKTWIFDKYGHGLPVGAKGELIIGGAGVGRGYLNLPQRTAEAFVTVNGRRAYRTGDVARFDASGEIEFYGRADNQVKLRGLRVELDEVTHAMESCPGVRQAIVVVLGSGEQQFLCGYYVSSRADLNANDIAAHMRATLAPYMVPAAFVKLDSMPMTANGKIDKRALPEPKASGQRRRGKESATALQRQLSALFAFALGVDSIGADENFFEAGGNSLLATKVAVKAMEAGLPIAYKDVFDYPTAEAMEGYILSQSRDASFAGDANGSGVPGDESATSGPPGETAASIRPSLAANRVEHLGDSVRTRDIGDVLLTGATGYLGIHVLKHLLDTTDHTVYCLVRGGDLEPEARLKTLLAYYFSTIYQEAFGSRIQVIDGDITDRDCMQELVHTPFDTVINCAASVKHFAADDSLDRVNWHGVENLVDLCVDAGRRLVQVSTVSVSGTSVNGQFSPERRIHEYELYFGQTLENKYCHSKFKAEEVILDAVEPRGLDARIVRVGNLSAHVVDGEFQINSTTNAFMRTMRAIAALGKVSVSLLDRELEFSPIDSTAAAVVALSGTEDYTVFHATNSHFVQMGDAVEAMNHCGIGVEIVDERAYQEAFGAALADEELSLIVSPLIAYQASDKNTVEFDIDNDNTFTVKVLYRLGFKWPIIDARYLDQMFEALETLGFFDVDGEGSAG